MSWVNQWSLMWMVSIVSLASLAETPRGFSDEKPATVDAVKVLQRIQGRWREECHWLEEIEAYVAGVTIIDQNKFTDIYISYDKESCTPKDNPQIQLNQYELEILEPADEPDTYRVALKSIDGRGPLSVKNVFRLAGGRLYWGQASTSAYPVKALNIPSTRISY